MTQLTCEMCNSTDVVKQDGFFICQSCGTKYSVEEAKRMMIEGTVDIQGTVMVDNSAFVEKYLANARRAKQKEDWPETEKYYNMVEQNQPTNIEAIFYSAFAQVKSALLEAETKEKRRGVFNILIKSVSVIDDNYDNTNEEHLSLLFKIMDDIEGLKKGTIVPTTHLQEYVTKNGYGNIVDRNQVVENDSLSTTYDMINEVLEAYMDSLANIIIEHSPEPIKKLFIENLPKLKVDFNSQVFKKATEFIDGYKTPEDICVEIAKQVKIGKKTKYRDILLQQNELAKTLCPEYITDNGTLEFVLSYRVTEELRKLYPNCKALKLDGCYVATCVYGSYDCPEVWTLRRFRDYTLDTTWYGRLFIKAYYAISPTMVKWFGETRWFKNLFKPTLDKMVSRLREKGYEDTRYNDKY